MGTGTRLCHCAFARQGIHRWDYRTSWINRYPFICPSTHLAEVCTLRTLCRLQDICTRFFLSFTRTMSDLVGCNKHCDIQRDHHYHVLHGRFCFCVTDSQETDSKLEKIRIHHRYPRHHRDFGLPPFPIHDMGRQQCPCGSRIIDLFASAKPNPKAPWSPERGNQNLCAKPIPL